MVSVESGSLLKSVALAALGLSLGTASILNAQAPAQSGRGGRGGPPQPAVISPEVTADRHITFRINAPQAQAVRMNASDIPNLGQSATLSKGENGRMVDNGGTGGTRCLSVQFQRGWGGDH